MKSFHPLSKYAQGAVNHSPDPYRTNGDASQDWNDIVNTPTLYPTDL